ncbi:DUF1433 domain-containing protein [Bacillus cereus]|uniref:DUF1433 domain-containing protein n=2 Tax=Bacillus cereus group TaxID=86661 RepID=A0A9X6Q106_BACTU|nr:MULTISPECIES: DUF1433 domain-containing protein [Bacillus cereus group]MDA2615386.1 DUF1433 domain-containing protein [Bacillus cereus]MDZ3953389.1 DUF1433 domain-containing protein [Bacillus thuringiensis]MEB8554414.1 DUF1433 domain-containing protein [Bacillus cereus]MEB8650894.1 DUF1433 domain-containing protein [Bacillus cereus]MEB8668184.1 DUF1433 domain-containing protein [Bacillus cereus]
MKKVMILVVSAVVIIAGGYFTMEYLNQKEQEEKFWKAQVEKYIHYNIQDVQSITFTKYEVSPMGIPKLKGYINKDEQLSFIAHISTTENFEDDFGCSGELDEMIKKPAKSVSEIEKEEKEKKQE